MRILSRLLLFSCESVEPDPRKDKGNQYHLHQSNFHAGKLTILLLLPFAAGQAQTAQVPALPVPIPALSVNNPGCTDPGWEFSFVPQQGKKVTFSLKPRTLLAAGPTTTAANTTSTKPTAVPVTLAGAQYTMVINVPTASETIKNPDGTTTITGVTVTLTPVVKP